MKKMLLISFLIIIYFDMNSQSKTQVNQNLFSMIELIANSEKHHEEEVQTTGFFKYLGGDKGILFFSKDDAKYNITKNTFIIYFSNNNLRDLKLKEINNHCIQISGIFSSKNKGFSNYYAGSISNINYIESLDNSLIEKQYIEIFFNKNDED